MRTASNIHARVNVGMKSKPGSISSTKLNTPPHAPFHPPKVLKKINAEIGAQIISPNSPRTGMAKEAYPIRSITIQNAREGILRIEVGDDIFFIIIKTCMLLKKLADVQPVVVR